MWDNEFILVSYPSGSMGAFLRLICEQLVWPHLAQLVDEWPRATAHTPGICPNSRQTEWQSHPLELISERNWNRPIIDQIRSVRHSRAIIEHEHPWSDHSRLLELFPNSRRIVITHDRNTQRLLRGMFLYKNLGLTAEEVKAQLDSEGFATVFDPRYSTNSHRDHGYLAIDLKDMIMDPSSLDLVASYINRPARQIARKTWASYMDAQRQHMPWFDHFLNWA